MNLAKLSTRVLILLSSLWLLMTWVTVALAQTTNGDPDSGDADELSGISVLLIVVALAAVAWFAYQRRSTKPR